MLTSCEQLVIVVLQKYKKVRKCANPSAPLHAPGNSSTFVPLVVSHAPTMIMPRILTTIAPVNSISGCFGQQRKSICKKTVIANIRRAPSAYSGGTPYQYFSVRQNARSTPYSTTEVEQQTRFGKVCKATSVRLKDPAQTAADLAAFKAQNEYKTLRQYVWHKVKETIE